MKFLILIIIFFTPFSLKATHFVGYDVEHVLNADSTVTFTVKLYRDCNGSGSIADSLSMRIQGLNTRNCFTDIYIDKLPQTRFIDNICNSDQITACINNAIEEITYQGTIDLLACDSNFSVMFSSCCRSGLITNIESPANTVMVAYTTLSLNNENISPHYNNKTVMNYCAGIPATYTHGIIEQQGDSLSFELIPSTRDLSTNVVYRNNYIYNAPLSLEPNTSFNINAQTGEITFTPLAGLVQNVIVTVKISEYRNGQIISTQTRELFFKIQTNCQNQAPVFSNIQINGNAIAANNIYNYCPNEDLNISLVVNDINTTQTLIMSTYFNTLFPNAQVTITGSNPLNYNLIIPASDLVNDNYILDFIAKDSYCPAPSQGNYSLLLKSINHTIAFQPMDTLCIGNIDTIKLQNPYQSYLWSTGETTPYILNNLQDSTYSVTVIDNNNCTYVSTISMHYYAPLDFTILTENISCASAFGRIEVLSNNTNLSFSINNQTPQNTPIFDSLSIGDFALKIIDINGCFFDTTITIMQIQGSNPTPLFIPNILCDNEIVTLGFVENFNTYLWSTGETTSTILSDGNTTNYSVTLTEANTCQSIYNFQLYYAGYIDFTANIVHNPCENYAQGEISLMHIPAAILYDYQISSGDTASSYGQFRNLSSGNYTITATDVYGCTRVEIYTINTLSYLQFIDITKDTIINQGNAVSLFSILNSNANIINQYWSLPLHISGQEYINESDIIIRPTQSDNYRFYVENEYGCILDTIINIGVIIVPIDTFFELKVPTAFTPNGDNENDLFRPIDIPYEYVEKMQIYNRWGNKVYDSDLSDGGWDGKYKNEPQPRDVYIVILDYKLPNRDTNQYRGEFILMR